MTFKEKLIYFNKIKTLINNNNNNNIYIIKMDTSPSNSPLLGINTGKGELIIGYNKITYNKFDIPLTRSQNHCLYSLAEVFLEIQDNKDKNKSLDDLLKI
jgi:hypothetical protein